jgi:hypothetical protein
VIIHLSEKIKTMRLHKYFILLVLLGSMLAGTMISCKKNNSKPGNYTTDKTRLKSLIDSLTAVSDTTTEGNKPGQYIVGSKTALDSVVALGDDVYNSSSYTQEEVNNAVSNLIRAGVVFSTQLLQAVSPENLMGYWKFNGNPADSSGHQHDGTLMTNWFGPDATHAVDGATLPKLVADRFGQANSAYYFEKGATIEVPYNIDLNPKSMTISLWLKIDVPSTGGDYMFALDRWSGYKLNLQGSNFLYFTVYGGNGYYVTDDDGGSGSAVNPGTWAHAAVSYDNAASTVKFYLNGKLVKTLTGKTGPPVTLPTPYNLTIGNEMPKSKYNLNDSQSPDYYWGTDNFTGTLDDVRFYNKALTDNEVVSIYTSETTP